MLHAVRCGVVHVKVALVVELGILLAFVRQEVPFVAAAAAAM